MTTSSRPASIEHATARPVLVTVSGTIPANVGADVTRGVRPRADYVVLAAAVSADVVDYRAAAELPGLASRAVAALFGRDACLAWACFRRRNDRDTMFTDSERVGMLYATLCLLVRKRPRHVMIGHRLSAPNKVRVHRLLRLGRRIDHVIVYSSAQRAIAISELGYPPERVTLTPFMVDTKFWRRDGLTTPRRARPMICAVGQELRDYPTLVAASSGLDVDIVIAAASPWSKRADTSAGLEIPANVSIRRLDPFDLRQLYAEASLVVVPLQDTDFQAGITTILEAMSMGVAVICTRTSGQTDTIHDAETGRYVAVGDAADLRRTITELLGDVGQRNRLAAAGQRWARAEADIEHYVATLASAIRSGG